MMLEALCLNVIARHLTNAMAIDGVKPDKLNRERGFRGSEPNDGNRFRVRCGEPR